MYVLFFLRCSVPIPIHISRHTLRVFFSSRAPQVTLKNYDPQRDKRFSGTFKLPTIPR